VTGLAQVDLPAPGPAPADVREAAGEILDGSEFDDRRSWLERLADATAGAFEAVIDAIAGLGTLAAILVVVGIVAIAAAALFFGVRSLVESGGWRRIDVGDDDGAVVVLGQAVDPDELAATAAAAEARGDLDTAFTARFRQLAVALVGAGVLGNAPGRTTGEYRDEFAEFVPREADAFAEVTRSFERVFYGHRPIGADELESLHRLAERLEHPLRPELVR